MLSNYTIKQMLPRLVVAAVLINISYWVCALAVDVSNLLGKSLYGVLAGLAPMHLDGDAIVALTQIVLSGGALAAGGALATGGVVALAGTTITGLFAAISGQLAIGVILLFVSLLLGAFAAIFVGLFILAARQALVIILIVVAPIAFALYILPGTKKLFDKWQKLFTTMLIFFPLFAVLYGGAQLAASILITLGTAKDGAFMLKGVFLFMGFCIQFVPLFFTWFLMTKATGFIGEAGSRALQRVNSLARDPLRSAAGKQFRSAGATTGAHIGGSFLRRGFGSTTRRGRTMQRLQRAIAGAGLSRAAEEAEFQEAKQSTIESDHRLSALHERAANAKERTEGVEAKMETTRLGTHEGSAARQARDNAKKLHKRQENIVEGERVRSVAGQAVDHALENSEEDLKTDQNISRIRRLATAQGRQSTQKRQNSEGFLKGMEADVDRERLTTVAGQRSYEFQKNAEGQLEAQQHTSEKLRLGTDAGKAVEFIKEDAAGELKIAQNDVKTERLQTRAVSRAIEHGVGNSSDILKAAQNKVETGRLATPQGQAAFEVLKNSEDKLTGQQNDSEAIRLTTDEGKASFKVREDSASNLKVAQSQAGQTRLQDAGSRRIEQAAKNAEDWLKAEQSDVETERIKDDVNGGAAAISAAKSAEVTRSSAATELDAKHMKDNNEIYVEQAASNEELTEAKSDLEQQVAGYRTDKGVADAQSNKSAAVSAAAERIKLAAKEKSLSDSAAEGNRAQYISEEAKRILDNANNEAVRAGGLVEHGDIIAQGRAKRNMADDFNKTTAAIKTLHSQDESEVLREKFDDLAKFEALSVEEIAGDAGLVASRQHVEEQIKLLGQLQDLGQQIYALPKGSPRRVALEDKLRTVVQQVSDDRKVKVAGLSTRELGANQRGEVAVDGKNVYDASRDRIMSHMTVERLATTPMGDPDQLRMYYDMAQAGKLSANDLEKIRGTYNEWKGSVQYKDSLSENQEDLFKAILGMPGAKSYKTMYEDVAKMS